EELRKWVATLDEQNVRFAEIERRLHGQEVELGGTPVGYLLIALFALLGTVGFVAWMVRDGNADAARTLENASAVLPSLAASLRPDPHVSGPRTLSGDLLPVEPGAPQSSSSGPEP